MACTYVSDIWVGHEYVSVIVEPFPPTLHLQATAILLSRSSRPSHLLPWYSWFSAPPILSRRDGSRHCLPFFHGRLLQGCLAVT